MYFSVVMVAQSTSIDRRQRNFVSVGSWASLSGFFRDQEETEDLSRSGFSNGRRHILYFGVDEALAADAMLSAQRTFGATIVFDDVETEKAIYSAVT